MKCQSLLLQYNYTYIQTSNNSDGNNTGVLHESLHNLLHVVLLDNAVNNYHSNIYIFCPFNTPHYLARCAVGNGDYAPSCAFSLLASFFSFRLGGATSSIRSQYCCSVIGALPGRSPSRQSRME